MRLCANAGLNWLSELNELNELNELHRYMVTSLHAKKVTGAEFRRRYATRAGGAFENVG